MNLQEKKRAFCGAAMAVFGLAACATEAGTGPRFDGDGPLYIIHSAVQSADERLNYFTVVDSLDEARVLDYANSRELAGRARLYAEEGIGFFAIGDGEDVTITRYDLVDGELVEGLTMSLQGHGVSSLSAQAVHFVSATKAYYKDAGQTQILVWNPTQMVVEESIDLPSDLATGDDLVSFGQWASREGEAYFAVGSTTPQYDTVRPGTTLVHIDTAIDEVTLTEDARCRGLSKTAELDGALYFFSDVINAFGYAVHGEDGGQADCILRIAAGETTFDDEYVGTLGSAFGDGKLGTIIAVTEDGEAWVQVVDLAVAPTEPGTTYGQWYDAGWSWWHLPLETLGEAVAVAGEEGAYSGFTLGSGSSFFVSQAEADYSESTLVDLSGAAPEAGLSFPGFVLDVARIR